MINLFNGFARFSSNPSWPFEVINKCVCICTHAYSNLKEVKYILIDDYFHSCVQHSFDAITVVFI